MPIKIDTDSTCAIPAHGALAKLIRATRLIVWDEASMSHRHILETVNRALCDIMKLQTTFVASGEGPDFGGKVVVLGGDFRQTLPVIPRASPAQILSASIARSDLWNRADKMRLHLN